MQEQKMFLAHLTVKQFLTDKQHRLGSTLALGNHCLVIFFLSFTTHVASLKEGSP
jgi:hypothetical protein